MFNLIRHIIQMLVGLKMTQFSCIPIQDHQATQEQLDLKLSHSPYEEGWIATEFKEDQQINWKLLYRGAQPPIQNEEELNDWIQIPHEKYIKLSKYIITEKLQHQSSFDPQEYQHFIELLEAIYHFKYHKILNELKKDYAFFSPDQGPNMRKNISEQELKSRENRLLSNLIYLMIRGNFNPLDKKHYLQSISHKYLLDLPVDINWDIYDPRLLKDFVEYASSEKGKKELKEITEIEHLEQYLNIPDEFNHKILIFHRGLERDVIREVFVLRKLAIMVDKLEEFILTPFQKIFQQTLTHGKNIATFNAFKKNKATANHPSSIEQAFEDDDHVSFLPIWIRRISLHNQKMGIKDLFEPMIMQEPIFDKMICIFRLYPYQHPPFLKNMIKKIPILKKLIKEPPEREVDHTIYIKMFSNIPLADMEVVFPEINIRMKPIDRFLLVILCLSGLSVGLSSTNQNTFIILISMIIGIGIKTILRFINLRRKYLLQMSQDIYRKNLDNYIGVIQYLIDNIEDQEFNEAFLAYMILSIEGREMTAQELDQCIEKALLDHFQGVEINFEIDDALDKIALNEGESLEEKQQNHHCFLHLVNSRLVVQNDGSMSTFYAAKPISEALHYMDHQWDHFFHYANKP
jgi:hypothetical protein